MLARGAGRKSSLRDRPPANSPPAFASRSADTARVLEAAEHCTAVQKPLSLREEMATDERLLIRRSACASLP